MEALVSADIPLVKLQNPKLNKVLTEKFGKLPCQKTVRENVVPKLYAAKMDAARQAFAGVPVVLMLDETRDATGRNVLNVLCGRLDGEPLKMRLIKVGELIIIFAQLGTINIHRHSAFIEKTDSSHVSQEFVRAINELKIEYNDVWLVVTDQAKYMVKCFRDLKGLFPRMNHVSCLAHAMHRVCEHIREKHDLVDNFLGKMRVVFTRSNDRSQLWKDTTGKFAYCL